jgi:hypothetical protein
MMIKIWLKSKAKIHLITIVGVGDGIEPNTDISKRKKNW